MINRCMTQDDFMSNFMQDVMNFIKGAKLKIKIIHTINNNNVSNLFFFYQD